MKNPISYNEALQFLKLGEPVAVPTETVYGLAACINNEQALTKVFEIKKRPLFDPLIVHCFDVAMAKQYIDPLFLKSHESFLDCLWKAFAPGPLTIIVKKNKKILPIITAGQETVGLRIPQHPAIRNLLRDLKIPLAAPSANLYSQLSPTKAEDVISIFNNQVPVLDGDSCELGLESTIIQIDIENKKIFILRPGPITAHHLQRAIQNIQQDFFISEKGESLQPGGQTTHYRPSAPLLIVESEKTEEEILVWLNLKYPENFIKALVLDPSPALSARLLYSQLRSLSKDPKSMIYVIKKQASQTSEDWKAIWNRLSKASSHHLIY